MDISVTKFKHDCLRLIHSVEKTGQSIAITRRGRVVARLQPCAALPGSPALKPWERLQALGGKLLAAPGESVLRDEDFEALR
jgi:antitoxin (DNA-binding transcriptional repressor) of toxin-antitoxin stability system